MKADPPPIDEQSALAMELYSLVADQVRVYEVSAKVKNKEGKEVDGSKAIGVLDLNALLLPFLVYQPARPRTTLQDIVMIHRMLRGEKPTVHELPAEIAALEAEDSDWAAKLMTRIGARPVEG